MRRKFLIAIAGLLLAVVIALAALPWWLGAALKAGGERFGVSFGQYQRLGYTRFALSSVLVKQPGVKVTVSQVEADTPLVWVWRRLAGTPGEVVVGRWEVQVTARASKPASPGPSGWVPLRRLLAAIIEPVSSWAPTARIGRGTVAWPGARLEISKVAWRDRTLTVEELAYGETRAAVVVHWPARGELKIEARESGDRWDAVIKSTGADVAGTGHFQGQPATLQAHFDPSGWLPAQAQVDAPGWSFAGDRLKLDGVYATVTGNAHLDWSAGRVAFVLTAGGTPVKGVAAPPLEIAIHGGGSLRELTLERIDVAAPGVEAHLSEPVRVEQGGRLLSGVSRFDLEVDLEQQSWLPGAQGLIKGSVQVTPQAAGQIPRFEASLTAGGIDAAGWIVRQARWQGRLEWPVLTMTAGRFDLDQGEYLEAAGGWDFQTKTAAPSTVRGKLSDKTLARLLPAGVQVAGGTFTAEGEGTWPSLSHHGTVELTSVQARGVQAGEVTALWKGRGPVLETVSAVATAGRTRVSLGGSLEPGGAQVRELILDVNGEPRLKLAAPVRVRWTPVLSIEPLRLEGPQGGIEASVAWGVRGELKLAAHHLESVWLRDLLVTPGPEWSLAALALQANWDRGPAVFSAEGSGSVALGAERKADLALGVRGDGKGVQIDTLRASAETQTVVRANGRVPLTFWPGQAPFVRFDPDAPLVLDALTEPNAEFWQRLSSLTGVTIVDPSLTMKLTGSWSEPLGVVELHAARLAADPERWKQALPAVETLVARLTGDRAGVNLETFSFLIAGQTVRASGRMPMEISQWSAFAKDPLALARAGADLRFEIPDAQVAALARYLPQYLAPTGRLQVDVAFKPGGHLEGFLRLKDAASRPLGPLGVLQSIGAEVEFHDRKVELKHVGAVTGGQPVALTGSIELVTGRPPKLDLALRGDNLPFVRQTGLLLRGDLALTLVTGDDDVTRIGGRVQLRDSLFLSDVRSFIPRGGTRGAPSRRPPYFAVDTPPLNAWGLNVDVRGDRFLKLRTPVFNGTASARFRLSGTLGDPRAVGEVTIDQGQVVLPFATFRIQQGSVRLTESDPHEPRISLLGTGRRYGYDLRMEVDGTASAPNLVFSSSPALESEQVLLLVMAGEAPQNEISFTGRQRAMRLGAYVGQSLLGQLGADPTQSDRLSLEVGERVSRQGRETYALEYQLNERWSLVGEYDEFDDYNVGVKRRIWREKKPDEPAETKPDAQK